MDEPTPVELITYNLGEKKIWPKPELLSPHDAIHWMRDMQDEIARASERASGLSVHGRGDHFAKDLDLLIHVMQDALWKALVLKEEAFKRRVSDRS